MVGMTSDADSGSVEPPESPSEPFFPVVGVDRTPTARMIAEGRIGNGAWDLTDTAIEAARIETHQIMRAEKDERRKVFNEAAKDALLDSVRLHHALVKRGLEVMERVNNPIEDAPVTQKDLTILSMAQKSSKELADRGMGKAKGATEDVETHSVLSMLIKGRES